MTLAELDEHCASIPLQEVGRLPGDAPAPFREALGKAQWRWGPTRKLLQLLHGKKISEVTDKRDEQQELNTRAQEHVIDTDGVLCKVGVPGATRPLPVVPDCKVGTELPEELRGSEFTQAKT